MSRHNSDKKLIPFHEFSTPASEEEWELLHEWQKELYRNVMKEIHQALVSLGCKIHGTLLSMNGREKVDVGDSHDSGRGPDPHDPGNGHSSSVDPDMLFFIKREEEQDIRNQDSYDEVEIIDNPSTGIQGDGNKHFKDTPKKWTSESNDDLSPGIQGDGNKHFKDTPKKWTSESNDDLSPDIVVITHDDEFSIKEEGDSFSVNHQNSERRDLGNPTGDVNVSFATTVPEKQHLKDVQKTSRTEENRYFSTVIEDFTPVLQYGFNETDETHSMPFGRRARVCNRKGTRITNTNVNFGKSVKCNDRLMRAQTITAKVTANVAQSFDEGTPSASQMWPIHEQERRGEEGTHWQPVHSSLHHSTSYLQTSDAYSAGESNVINTNITTNESNTVGSWLPHTSAETQQTSPKESHIRQKRMYTEKKVYTEYKRGFSAKSRLPRHEKSLSGEKRYHCTLCEKSFTQRGILIRHQRTHTGERPYQCIVCGKSFKQKEVLIRHQKIHTGERPYQCSVCGKRFNRKETVIRHQTIHTKESARMEWADLNREGR